MRGSPILARRMRRDEIHQFQRVVCVGHCGVELPQGQAANPPVVVLHEFAVDLETLFVSQQLRRILGAAQLLRDVFQIGWFSARPLAIGPASELHLQHAHSIRICSTLRRPGVRTIAALITPG